MVLRAARVTPRAPTGARGALAVHVVYVAEPEPPAGAARMRQHAALARLGESASAPEPGGPARHVMAKCAESQE